MSAPWFGGLLPGVGGIALGLVGLALCDAVVLDQILVQVGKAPGRLCRGQRLAVSADRAGKVRRIHDCQRGSLLDAPSAQEYSRDTGPEKGARTLVAWSLSKSTTPLASIVR